MTDWVLAVEQAYVAAATGGVVSRGGDPAELPRARAALGAVASRYLAVGTPRTLGLVGEPEAVALSVAAHRAWFAPRELRTAGVDATLAEALACDIVCVHGALHIEAAQLRRGTHVNVLGPATIDDALRAVATVATEAELAALAAGLVDGRQLDELTVFIAGDAQLALAALHGRS